MKELKSSSEIRVTAIAAAHEFLDEDPATALHPYLGYLVEGNEFRLYHAGDTCVYEGMQAELRASPWTWRFCRSTAATPGGWRHTASAT